MKGNTQGTLADDDGSLGVLVRHIGSCDAAQEIAAKRRKLDNFFLMMSIIN